ncbi:hypothetical protein [Companilactobacillus metriopterae]|uniref:hypothetical protein n=1 Tax=Companilactobacillus metriopterae TaxID=1909267 RepID=UPI00100AFFB4|nr:hypothetical protein [Companilactobacillus metriopterae]
MGDTASVTSVAKASNENINNETVSFNNSIEPLTNTDISTVILVNNPLGARLYDSEGKLVTNRRLGSWTSWYTDKKRVANKNSNVSNSIWKGVYYRVSTNEYVRAYDVVNPLYNQPR